MNYWQQFLHQEIRINPKKVKLQAEKLLENKPYIFFKYLKKEGSNLLGFCLWYIYGSYPLYTTFC